MFVVITSKYFSICSYVCNSKGQKKEGCGLFLPEALKLIVTATDLMQNLKRQ